jgi:hypothetical protein
MPAFDSSYSRAVALHGTIPEAECPDVPSNRKKGLPGVVSFGKSNKTKLARDLRTLGQ